jgi:hypothetical protein
MTRNWLQRSQSHNEVIADDVVDRGRYQISLISIGNARLYFINLKEVFVEQILRKHFVCVTSKKDTEIFELFYSLRVFSSQIHPLIPISFFNGNQFIFVGFFSRRTNSRLRRT